MRELAIVADAPLPALPRCDPHHLAKCLRYLSSNLSQRQGDERRDQLRVAAYQRFLGRLPKEQIDFICLKAMERLRWFPSIEQCLAFAAEWKRGDAIDRENARARIRNERQARLEETLAQIAAGDLDQAAIDALDDRTKAIADAQNLLLRTENGGFIVRPSLLKSEENG